jgi:hypothetical protein
MSYALAGYALAGTAPSPIPSLNTSEVRGFTVGSYVMGLLGPSVPWLDANLIVRNITADQAARSVADTVRSALTVTGATVDDVRWVEGGYLHVRWRPNSERPAIDYATSVRDTLLRAALDLSPRSQIIMTRFRVDMPTGRTNLYVYPIGAPPPPPAPLPGTLPPPSADVPPPPESGGSSGALVGVAAIGVLAVLGGVGYYLSRRNKTVRKNRRRSRRRR